MRVGTPDEAMVRARSKHRRRRHRRKSVGETLGVTGDTTAQAEKTLTGSSRFARRSERGRSNRRHGTTTEFRNPKEEGKEQKEVTKRSKGQGNDAKAYAPGFQE